jgi:predicted ATPase
MLTKIAIENFKSIGKRIELELKPLTILVGPNASGKSSILEALCLFVQSIRTGTSGFDLSGNYYPNFVKYSKWEDVAHKGDLKKPITIEIHIKLTEDEISKLVKKPGTRDMLASVLSIDEINSIGCYYSYGIFKEGSVYAEQGIFCSGKKIIEVRAVKTDSSYKSVFTFPEIIKGEGTKGSVEYLLHPQVFEPLNEDKHMRLTDFATEAANIIASRLKPSTYKSKVYFLSAQRGEIKPEVGTGEIYEWVGKKGEYLLYILSRVSSPEYEQKKMKIEEWALKFEIKNPWAGWVGSGKASGEFIDAKLEHPLNLAFASFGSSQILTVITQLFWSNEGDMILIEEPEISIHPKGQVMLTELFADAIKEGKQVVITTHSGYLPIGFT